MSLPVPVSGPGALPEYGSTAAAGADLRASEPASLPPRGIVAVHTALHVAIPPGYVGLVWPRSGLALKHGIDTLAGVIDSDYRGEVRVVLVNHGGQTFEIAVGDRIAQLLIQPIVKASFELTEQLPDTARGAKGFGSTGAS